MGDIVLLVNDGSLLTIESVSAFVPKMYALHPESDELEMVKGERKRRSG